MTSARNPLVLQKIALVKRNPFLSRAVTFLERNALRVGWLIAMETQRYASKRPLLAQNVERNLLTRYQKCRRRRLNLDSAFGIWFTKNWASKVRSKKKNAANVSGGLSRSRKLSKTRKTGIYGARGSTFLLSNPDCDLNCNAPDGTSSLWSAKLAMRSSTSHVME